jgi:Arc/MetJ-type ribon-helix-helix transcriptional regulator
VARACRVLLLRQRERSLVLVARHLTSRRLGPDATGIVLHWRNGRQHHVGLIELGQPWAWSRSLFGVRAGAEVSSFPPAFFYVIHIHMAKSNKVIPKKKRGRPATGKHPLTALRLPANLTKAIEAWAIKQGDEPNRSEAIRRLVELGLTVKPISSERTRSGRSLDLGAMAKIEHSPAKTGRRRTRARELAAEAIDKMADPTAHPDERAQRRQRLTKGPPEFREDRVDLPKVKAE